MKKCIDCKKTLSFSSFTKQSSTKDGLDFVCRECKKKRKLYNSRTKEGVLSAVYSDQKASSKKRGHRAPEYTKDELKEWLFSQTKFHEIFNEWTISGYKKRLKPSIDRKNDYIHYCFSNIQLMTYGENFDKGHADRVNGKNNKVSKKVVQKTKDGVEVSRFHSMHEAERRTGVSCQNIHKVCNGERKYAGGYKWELI